MMGGALHRNWRGCLHFCVYEDVFFYLRPLSMMDHAEYLLLLHHEIETATTHNYGKMTQILHVLSSSVCMYNYIVPPSLQLQ